MRWPRRLTVSARLALLFTGVTLLILALTGTGVYVMVGDALLERVDSALTEQASDVVDDLADDDGDEAGTDEIDLDDLMDEPAPPGVPVTGRQVQVLTADGMVLGAVGDVAGRPPLLDGGQLAIARSPGGARGTVASGGDHYHILALTVPGTTATAVLAADLDAVTEPQAALLAAFVPAGLVAALVAGVLGWLVARRGLAPIKRMDAQARTIDAGGLDRRLPVPDTGDEVAGLGLTINAMLDRLAGAIDRERAFTADASHELRTPLAILRAEMELARNRAGDGAVRGRLDSALGEADRLAALVDDLLVLARADANRLDGREPVDVGDVVGRVADRFDVLAHQRGIRLAHDGDAVVAGDRRGIERALANLVDNAVRHTPDGGSVCVRCRPEGRGGTLVTVEDSGPGVPPERLARLFERFTRADDARTGGGAGLGLAIVAAVAAAHAGSVNAANRPGGGLRVELRLRSYGPSPSPQR